MTTNSNTESMRSDGIKQAKEVEGGVFSRLGRSSGWRRNILLENTGFFQNIAHLKDVLYKGTNCITLPLSLMTVGAHLLRTASPRSPTRSLCGPVSTEFQFHDTGDSQFVNPS